MLSPKKVKIGAHSYTVENLTSWPDMDAGTLGETDTITETIYIRDGLSDTAAFSVLLHEALHVMNQTLDHALLDSLSEQLAQFLLDNHLVTSKTHKKHGP